MSKRQTRSYRTPFLILCGVLFLFILAYVVLPGFFSTSYDDAKAVKALSNTVSAVVKPEVKAPEVAHIPTPKAVKAIYMTSWVAGTQSIRKNVIAIADTTEANAIMIDIKDYTGQISFEVNDPELKKIGSDTRRIADIDELIKQLHEKNIYVIGRVAVFQDPYMVKLHPEWAVKRSSDGGIWQDRKGITWIDAGAKDNWNYIAQIARESYNRGFDEINLDYIRFPSDGNMKDIAFPFSKTTPKPTIMKQFYQYIADALRKDGIVSSADLFGMTTTAHDDMNIGQVLTDALENFDFVAPMVYPSHFPATWNGYANPAAVPYKVIKDSMSSAVQRAKMMGVVTNASTTPAELAAAQKANQKYVDKLRPWLQDFNLGATYTVAMVKDQIQATYDVGLNSWMIWDPNNKYTSTKGALLPQ